MLYTNFSVRPMVLMLVPWESYGNGNFVPNRQEFSYAEISPQKPDKELNR